MISNETPRLFEHEQTATHLNRNPKRKSRGRVDIIRETAGRGGKTVTGVQNFVRMGLPEKEKLANEMQRARGVGGTVKEAKSRFRETSVKRSQGF